MTRYSRLKPLSVKEKIEITGWLLSFFSVMNNKNNKDLLGLTSDDNVIKPLTVMNFFTYHKNICRNDLMPKWERIRELILLLQNKGVLIPSGSIGGSEMTQCYYSMYELTNIEKKGYLFFGKYLGKDFIAHQIEQNLAYITGKTSKGDEAVGTGILLTDNLVLTCAHVLKDMTIDNELEIYHQKYGILKYESHKDVDVGVIILKDRIIDFHKDIALRNSNTLEEIVIAGFPKIPRNLNKTRNPVTQSGEIASRISTYDGDELELFTAIAQPGNSGGPVLSLDGKVLGIVTKSLERKMEDSDLEIPPMPFFASIPADIIMKSFGEMKLALEFVLPWENFE